MADYDAFVVIPYRNRAEDLEVFKQCIPAAFKAQGVNALFIVSEQADGLPFNRGKSINVGWCEVMKRYPRARSFYFHDVDTWPVTPTSFHYKTPKSGGFTHIFGVPDRQTLISWGGGCGSISRLALLKTNGYPNDFWGWGGEDNVLGNRLLKNKVDVYLNKKVFRGQTDKVNEKQDQPRDMRFQPENARRLYSGEADGKENGITNCHYCVVGEEVDKDGFLWLRCDYTPAEGAAAVPGAARG